MRRRAFGRHPDFGGPLWPRGVARDEARIDAWIKDIAPSDGLRHWYSHDPKKWSWFRTRYLAELTQNKAAAELCDVAREATTITLLYAAKDIARNNAIVFARIPGGRRGGKETSSFRAGPPRTGAVRPAQDVERDRAINLLRIEQAHKIIGPRDGGAIEGEQNIAGEQARVIGRTACLDSANHRAHPLREAESQRDPARQRHCAGADAEIGAADPSMRHEFAEHETCRIGRHREANALRAGNNRGVDADDLTLR